MARRRSQDRSLSEFGETFEAWRKQHGLSQRVVAALIGTHQRTLSDWLRSDGMPGAVHQMARLAALMGASVEELVGKDAETAPLHDAAYVRSLLARTASPAAVRRYLRELEQASKHDTANE